MNLQFKMSLCLLSSQPFPPSSPFHHSKSSPLPFSHSPNPSNYGSTSSSSPLSPLPPSPFSFGTSFTIHTYLLIHLICPNHYSLSNCQWFLPNILPNYLIYNSISPTLIISFLMLSLLLSGHSKIETDGLNFQLGCSFAKGGIVDLISFID